MRLCLIPVLIALVSLKAENTLMVIEYTTDGDVTLNIMNITFHTTELHVTLLGCDVGYYDQYRIRPPAPSIDTHLNPFHCMECRCETFESVRSEAFVPSEIR